MLLCVHRDLEDNDQYYLIARWRKVWKANSFILFILLHFSAGNDWLNRLTTTDGVEITFDPLLLEGDKEFISTKDGR